MINKLPLDELSTAFAHIMGLLLTETEVDRAVQHLAEAIKDSVPGTLGAGVSILDSQARRTSAGFTDPVVEQVDRVQYDLGQGPCLSAWASGEPMLVEDVPADPRWPEWRAAITDLPVRSVISVPLKPANAPVVGALKIYAAPPYAYGLGHVELLELFATPAATLLSHIQSSGTIERISEAMEQALQSRDVVNQARGLLCERHRITPDEALQRLVRTARINRSTVQAVSAALMADPATGSVHE